MASDKVKLTIHTAKHAQNPQGTSIPASRLIPRKKRISMQDRLLRNSCLACALLLGILALGNVQQPWAKNTSAAIERALTMEIDLDQSLGQLQFVQKLMPESALVFFNLNSENELMQPVQATLSHPYSALQPWLMYSCEADSSVSAAADGVVSAVSPTSDGTYAILIDHGEGLESVTACMDEVQIQQGASVMRGGIIGKSSKNLYFELRQSGDSIDPSEKMGL